MKSMSYVSVMIILGAFVNQSANADIMILDQKTGHDSGYFIKVVKEGNQVSYQFFQGGQYVKDLGNVSAYPVDRVLAYSESLPGRISTDSHKKWLVRAGVAVVGAGIGYLFATHRKASAAAVTEATVEESGMLKRLFLNYKPYFFAAAGGLKFSIFGGYISDLFLVSAEEHEVRAALTSQALMENGRVIFLTTEPAKAIHELDTALKEL